MNRATLARRYMPLAVALGVQLLVIAVAPSTAPQGGTLTQSQSGAEAIADGTGGTESGTGPVAGAGRAGTTGSAVSNSVAVGAPPGVKGGDTSHCVNGRQFDPAIAWHAPPCVPGTPGAPYSNNGGATYQGVTKSTITIIDYVSNFGAEVNAILEAQGQLVTADEAKIFDRAMASFINKYYLLYGRKVSIITYQGQCQSVPPDVQCLRTEIDRIIDTYHPYMFFWNTTLCSECYREIARKKTVAMGGVGFSDELSNALAPYFYSASESATRIEIAFAQWWCNQMSSVNVPSRRVKWASTRAGPQNPAQNFNGEKRRLGVISTNDPDNEDTVTKVLGPALKKGCGDKIWHTYFYDQNINTAAQQVEAGIAAMNTPQNPANVVLCLCDSVAPAFVYQGEQNHNYYPENLIATNQQMDYDQTAQSYMEGSDGSPSLACPTPARGCEFDHAFGLSVEYEQEPQNNNVATRVYRAGGGKGPLPMQPLAGLITVEHYLLMANLIQNTGPNLTPASMQARAPAIAPIGGGSSGRKLLALGANNWQWFQDVRIVYWDRARKSPWNGVNGSFAQIEGPRFNLGQFPVYKDGPPLGY
jgi:hypothetical protein